MTEDFSAYADIKEDETLQLVDSIISANHNDIKIFGSDIKDTF